jgi:hypothetical protein
VIHGVRYWGEQSMNIGGWIVMTISVGAVLSLVAFCITRVLALPPLDAEAHLKAPLDIDTGDTQDPD